MRPGKIALVPLISILIGVLVLIVVVFVMYQPKSSTNQNTNTVQNTNLVACPRDAKICPDGSTVGRVPPSCEFTPCPILNSNVGVSNTNVTTNTNTNISPESYTNQELGFRLQLPFGWDIDTERSSVDEIVFTDSVTNENKEAVKSTLTTQTLREWTELYAGENGYRVTDYTLDGQAGKRVRFNGIGADFIGVKVGDRLFVITVGRMETNGMLDTLDVTL